MIGAGGAVARPWRPVLAGRPRLASAARPERHGGSTGGYAGRAAAARARREPRWKPASRLLMTSAESAAPTGRVFPGAGGARHEIGPGSPPRQPRGGDPGRPRARGPPPRPASRHRRAMSMTGPHGAGLAGGTPAPWWPAAGAEPVGLHRFEDRQPGFPGRGGSGTTPEPAVPRASGGRRPPVPAAASAGDASGPSAAFHAARRQGLLPVAPRHAAAAGPGGGSRGSPVARRRTAAASAGSGQVLREPGAPGHGLDHRGCPRGADAVPVGRLAVVRDQRIGQPHMRDEATGGAPSAAAP